MDDRTVDLIFAGSLESLPPVSSKIVRIFTSSTFTGKRLLAYIYCFSMKIRNKTHISIFYLLYYTFSNNILFSS